MLFRPINEDVEKLEAYLNRASAPLLSLSIEAREEARAEMRIHLEELIRAYEELGCSHAEAVEAAIRQFGHAHQIARKWDHTTTRLLSHALGWYGLWVFVPAAVMTTLFLSQLDNFNLADLRASLAVGFLIAPVATSFAFGLHTQKSQMRTALIVQTLFIVMSCIVMTVIAPYAHNPLWDTISFIVRLFVGQAIFCSVLAMLSACYRRIRFYFSLSLRA